MINEKGKMIKMTMDDVWGIAMVVVMASWVASFLNHNNR